MKTILDNKEFLINQVKAVRNKEYHSLNNILSRVDFLENKTE